MKPSDLSIVQAALQLPEEKIQIATTKNSANFIFYSVLQSWGLAQLLPLEKLSIPSEDQERLNDTMRIFLLSSDAKSILLEARKQALSSGNRPKNSIFTKESVDILKIYEAEGNEEARAKLVEIYTDQLAKIYGEKKKALEQQAQSQKIFGDSSVHSLLGKPTLLKIFIWLGKVLTLWLFLTFMFFIPLAIYAGDTFMLVFDAFFAMIFGAILWITNPQLFKNFRSKTKP
ncbi:MAG: hypothetical protein HYU57_05160 [Micavibrio aeruginosavorus]|nr:hypothetical protein [Micavibrio aeruginosavorus]